MDIRVVRGRAKLLDSGRLKDATFWSDTMVVEYYEKEMIEKRAKEG